MCYCFETLYPSLSSLSIFLRYETDYETLISLGIFFVGRPERMRNILALMNLLVESRVNANEL